MPAIQGASVGRAMSTFSLKVSADRHANRADSDNGAMKETADDIIRRLQLVPHPEGGHYRRIYASDRRVATRRALTCIAFLLANGECSRWHRVDGEECWHWQQGAELELLTWNESTAQLRRQRLGSYAAGAEPMLVVPSGVWQAAQARHGDSLVVCTVSPGFVWQGFEMLAEDAALAGVLRDLDAWME